MLEISKIVSFRRYFSFVCLLFLAHFLIFTNLAPEIITGEGHNKSADWWSYGILIFEMLCGIPPFYCENTERMYDLITNAELRFPKRVQLSEEAKDLIKNSVNPTKSIIISPLL